MRIDLNLMVVFEAIYRARSLSAAGPKLGLSQPAMSHALARLRHTLGDPLFVRVSRGLQPTPFAERIAPGISDALAVIRASFERTTFDPASERRLFTIAMADIGEVSHLPHLLRGLEKAPGVTLRTVERPPDEVRAGLAEGKIDLALWVNQPAKAPFREALLVEHGYATIARSGHPAIRSRLTLEQFRKARHLLVMPAGPFRHGEVIERALRGAKVRANIAVEVAHFHPVAALVTQSDLIATIPRGLAQTIARMAPVRVFDTPVTLPKARITLVWHERFERDPANAWLRELYLRQVRPIYNAR